MSEAPGGESRQLGAQPMSGIFGYWLLARPLAGTVKHAIWMEYFPSCLGFLTTGQASFRFSKGRKERLPFCAFPNVLLRKKYNTDFSVGSTSLRVE